MISEAIVRRDRSGRTVWLSEYSQTGTGWARTEARIADGRAEIAHRTRSERWTTGIPLPAGRPLRRRPRAAQGLGPAGDAAARVPGLQPRGDGGGPGGDRGRARGGARCRRANRGAAQALRGELPARGRAAAARPRQSHRRDHPAELRHEHHHPPDRPRDRAEAAPALLHAAQRPGALALSNPGRCAAGAYPLSLRLSGRPRLRSAANRRAARDGHRGAASGAVTVDICAACGPGPCRRRGRASPGAAPDPLAAKRPSAHPGDRGDLSHG